jgi:two-component sensor histidine kinase
MTPHRRLNSTVTLAPGPMAPRAARNAVRQALPDTDPRVVERAMLLTSELVTNAVIHAATPLTLDVTVGPSTLHVLVDDGDTRPPVPSASRGAHGGYGLQIVEQLADAWGTTPRASGKSVWFELALHQPPDVRASLQVDDLHHTLG